MKRKEDNNLILMTINDVDKYYFTSMSRAGSEIKTSSAYVKLLIDKKCIYNPKLYGKDLNIKIELVDGSEIPYKQINNEIDIYKYIK